ncbi:IS1595 family transposase, partial [Candidatus Synechococcus spongiarum]
MEYSKLGFQIWVIAIFLIATNLKGISSMKLHRDLGITQKSVCFLAHRIRESFDFSWLPGFDGPIEADETFVGGKRKNMFHDKRKEQTGRGPVGKVIVAGVKDRKTGQVSARVVKGTDAATLKGFVRYHAEPGTTVYTDEALDYQGMTDMDYQTVNHGVGEYVDDMGS